MILSVGIKIVFLISLLIGLVGLGVLYAALVMADDERGGEE